jgi:NAD+ synthase
MGLTYQEIDEYLVSGAGSDTVKEKIEEMFAISAHKRKTPPIPDF